MKIKNLYCKKMLEFNNDASDIYYFSTIENMKYNGLPKCAGWIDSNQVKYARVTMRANIINEELIDKVNENAELTALSCRNSIVSGLKKMIGVELSKFDNYLAFWRTGVIPLVIIGNHNLLAGENNSIEFCNKNQINLLVDDIPYKVLTFNLDAIDKNLDSDHYTCLLF